MKMYTFENTLIFEILSVTAKSYTFAFCEAVKRWGENAIPYIIYKKEGRHNEH